MAVAPSPSEIFERAVKEGKRRLEQTLLELASTSIIAGYTIVLGIVAMGLVQALVEPHFGADFAKVTGALAFGVGLVFLIVGRAEFFSENLFDPTASVVEHRHAKILRQLVRLWAITFMLNLVGGAGFGLIFSVDGSLPSGAGKALSKVATEIVGRDHMVVFVRSITGGVLVTLLSFLLAGMNQVTGRALVAYAIGFLLALGPFDHVIVTALHLLLGTLHGARVGLEALAILTAISLAGNLVGGLGLVTLTHIAQAKGARKTES